MGVAGAESSQGFHRADLQPTRFPFLPLQHTMRHLLRPARFFALSLVTSALLAACGGGDDEERTPTSLTLSKIGGYTHTGGETSAEITAFDPLSKRLFVVNGAQGTVDVLDLSDPTTPKQVGSIAASALGVGLAGINSVAVYNGIVALAVEASPKQNNGVVAWVRARDLAVLGTDAVGALPDMLTFSPDGQHLLVANEGEPNSYGQPDSVDPEGSISLIAVSGLSPTATTLSRTVTQLGFTAFNSQVDALRAAGVRIFGPGATVAQDLEPEYITVSANSKTAYVTLQENNAVAVVDIASKTITAIKPLGTKNHNLAGMGMDVSDEDGGTNTNSGSPATRIAPVPTKGLYLPDAIASYQVAGQTYLVTANEGDARDYTGFTEEVRIRAHCDKGLDPTVFANADQLILDSNLGRLRVTASPNGHLSGKNAAGQCTELYTFGARSFTVWDAASVTPVFDSGDAFEKATTALLNAAFNASNSNNDLDSRSASKGPEPEGVALGKIGNKTFAFIGLERVGGVMVYDVSNPSAPVYVTYLNTREGTGGDRGPEGLAFVSAKDSPNGKPLLIVGNETSGTTAVLQLNLSY